MKRTVSNSGIYVLIAIFIIILVIFIWTDKTYIESLVQLFVVLFTFFAAFSAYKSSHASERASRGLFLPIIKIQIDEFDKEKFSLNLKNIGKQIAQDVRIEIPHAHSSEGGHVGYINRFEVIEMDESGIDHVTYEPKMLSKNPEIVIQYKDIFGGELETRGVFSFRLDDKMQAEQIEGVAWEFHVDS